MSVPPSFRVILTFAAVTLLCGCAHLSNSWVTPGVNLVGIKPAGAGLDHQAFVVSLNVNNPNNRPLPIEAATYKLEVEGREIATGTSRLETQIPAYAEGVVDLSVHTETAELIEKLSALTNAADRWGYLFSGTLDLAGGYVPVPFCYQGEVDAGRIMSGLMP